MPRGQCSLKKGLTGVNILPKCLPVNAIPTLPGRVSTEVKRQGSLDRNVPGMQNRVPVHAAYRHQKFFEVSKGIQTVNHSRPISSRRPSIPFIARTLATFRSTCHQPADCHPRKPPNTLATKTANGSSEESRLKAAVTPPATMPNATIQVRRSASISYHFTVNTSVRYCQARNDCDNPAETAPGTLTISREPNRRFRLGSSLCYVTLPSTNRAVSSLKL